MEDLIYKRKIEPRAIKKDPVFIIGHWRSGTTFVHSLLSQDSQFGYNTTYQTVFPNLMLFGQSFFKKQMAFLMPDKRPTDNMELKVDLPQEEEFTLGGMMPYSHYNFWFFPKKTQEYVEKYLLMKMDKEELSIFTETFIRLIKTSLWNTKGEIFLSKNPPHTSRIKELLKIFPNAKFIYLIRNPYTVFESTRNYFSNTIIPLQLQTISPQEIEENVITTYIKLYQKYELEKSLIPKGNLIEMKFEDIETDPLGSVQKIYSDLGLEGFCDAKPLMEKYIGGKKGYKKNAYAYEPHTLEVVEQNWAFALEQWGYDRIKTVK